MVLQWRSAKSSMKSLRSTVTVTRQGRAGWMLGQWRVCYNEVRYSTNQAQYSAVLERSGMVAKSHRISCNSNKGTFLTWHRRYPILKAMYLLHLCYKGYICVTSQRGQPSWPSVASQETGEIGEMESIEVPKALRSLGFKITFEVDIRRRLKSKMYRQKVRSIESSDG